MPTQDELFALPTGFLPDTARNEPRLWVRELRIYRVLAPGDSNLLRRISLRPGLNILWAKPQTRTRVAQRPSVSGHATGKTTFCRFLRYLLGESTFGNDDQRTRLRDAFPEGCVVGEVRLEGTPWLVCRPFRVGGAPHLAFRNRTIETLFANDDGRQSFETFRQELTRLLAEPLPVATFATAPTAIEWPHLIQWLTRDQECRFAGLGELRHTSSDSQSPNLMIEDAHFLFRAVLGLIDTTEQSELETNRTLLKKKQDAERMAPLLAFRGDEVFKRLRKQHADFRLDLDGAPFLQAVADEWTGRAEASAARLKALIEPESLKSARDRFLEARDVLRRANERKRETEHVMEFIEQQLRQIRGEITSSDLAAWVKTNAPSEHECGRTLAEAIEWECPLAAGRTLPIESKARVTPTASTAERLNRQKAHERARLQQLNAAIVLHAELARTAEATLREETEKHDRTRSALSLLQADDHAVAADARRAHADKIEADRLEESLKELEQAIRRSQERQTAIREQQNAALSAFSETFARIAKATLGDEVTGSIRFNGRKLRPTLVHDIDLTSAALETLKIICFDLAALVSGVEGRGRHPLFLIHDGPREADMDATLYAQIFRLARSLEDSFGERPITFQYIVTTTEPPPEDVQVAPWLLAPVLDATTADGKLLGTHF